MFPTVTETAPPPWWTEIPSLVQSQMLWEQRMELSLLDRFSRDALPPDTTVPITELPSSNSGTSATLLSPASEMNAITTVHPTITTTTTVAEVLLKSGDTVTKLTIDPATTSMSNAADRMGPPTLGFRAMVGAAFLGVLGVLAAICSAS